MKSIQTAGMKAWTAIVVIGMIILGAGRVEAQGPVAAQVQAALRAFLAIAHTWTGTQTFTDITVSGTCTGCGGGGSGSPGGATNTSQYNAGGGNFGGAALNATATNKFLRQVSSGAPSYQQPASADLSDTANIPLINAANVFSSATGQSMKKLLLPGSSSGTETIVGPATGGGTLTLPGGTIDFSASGGAGQFVKQNSSGGAFTVVAVAESEVTFTDITTGNASTTKHGYVPKLPNDATKFYDGTGAFSVPSGGGGTPGGATNTVQYNGGSSTFAGIALNATATAKFVKQVSSGAPTIEQIADADLSFTDITTNNATSSAHGYMKKLSGNAYDFVLGDGSMGRTLAGGTLTTAQPWTLTQTWNAVGTVFNLLDVSVTRTASADASHYVRVRNGAGEIFTVTQAAAASDKVCLKLNDYDFGNSGNVALTVTGNRTLTVGAVCGSGGGGVTAQTFDTGTLTITSHDVRLSANSLVQFSTTSDVPSATKDIGITRNGAGVLEVNNGTAGAMRDLKLRHTLAAGTAPTAGSCATSPGTPSGADEAGRIAVGTSPSNTCVVTFGTAYTTKPVCGAFNETTAPSLIVPTATTTQVTFTQYALATGMAANYTAADVIAWRCTGY